MLVFKPNSLSLWIGLTTLQRSEVKSPPSLSLSLQRPWQMLLLPLRFRWLRIQCSVEYTDRIWTQASTPNICLQVWQIEYVCCSSRWQELLTRRARPAHCSQSKSCCYLFFPLFDPPSRNVGNILIPKTPKSATGPFKQEETVLPS